MTRRLLLSILLVSLCGFMLLYTGQERQSEPEEETLSAEQELEIKHALTRQDIQRTDELCRTQCELDFRRALRDMPQTPDKAEQVLGQLRHEHPHMSQVIWTMPVSGGTGRKQVVSGEAPAAIRKQTERHMSEAVSTVTRGRTYKSPPIKDGNLVYFVLGVPSVDGKSALYGVIKQDILQKVETDARKNLRLVPYPSDKQWSIESVDADTLRDVRVDHPEENEGISHYSDSEVVVRFKDNPSDAQIEQIRKEIRAQNVKKIGYTYVFQSTGMKAKQLMQYFQQWDVAYVEPHYLYTTNGGADGTEGTDGFEPNDILFRKYQWNLPAIEALEGWELSKGSKEVIVAVIDTGVDLNHPDLRPNTLDGVNLINENRPPMDDVGHGTHVAGIISALVNNAEGVAGLTWHNPVLPVKALDQNGAGDTYSVAQAIVWATDHGAKVINMSLGNYAQAQFLHDAIRYAYDRDVLIIAASGNDNTEQPGYPAAYPEVFAVAATDGNKRKAPFSNYGDYIDVAAPGVSIASTYPGNHYAALSGTSMASPHVAAVAALIRSVNPMLKNTDVMEIMRQTAEDLGPEGKDKYYGYGQIDTVAALRHALQTRHSLTLWSQWLDRQLAFIRHKYTSPGQST